jgi:hypothetical protein
MMDNLNQVHSLCFKTVNQNGVKKYTLREDTSIEPGISAKTQNLWLEGFKKEYLKRTTKNGSKEY